MRVGEAKQRDIGKKRARIGPDAMDYLQVTPGDVIQINAKRSPPIPHVSGATTPWTALTAIAASIALPPAFRIFIPACVERK